MNKNELVKVKCCFEVSQQTLWNAITRLSEMQQWFFENIPAFEARVGFTTRFQVVSGTNTFTHEWKILEVIPEQKIVYRWSYAEYQGWARVTFEIKPNNQKRCLLLKHKAMEDFPENIPEFSLKSCRVGWEYFINERLKEYLIR